MGSMYIKKERNGPFRAPLLSFLTPLLNRSGDLSQASAHQRYQYLCTERFRFKFICYIVTLKLTGPSHSFTVMVKVAVGVSTRISTSLKSVLFQSKPAC